MRSRLRTAAAAEPATADLFADAVPAPKVVPTPAPTAATPNRAPSLVSPALPALPLQSAQLRHQPLWYAVVFPELPAPDAAMLQRLSMAALRFTSLVSIEMPNALLLEINGSVKLFGSLETLHAGLDAAWKRLSLRACSATAPTTLAALWLARAGEPARIVDPSALAGALAKLPIGCTAWDAERLQTLRSMGVRLVGELLRLPRAGLGRRVGPAAVMDLDVALGKQAAPRRAFVARERFRERCDFESEIETVVYLQKAIEPLIERCARFLRERQAGVQWLELRLRHRVISITRVRLGLASITGERRRLADVLDERLQRLELRAPVRGMELRSGSLQPLSAQSIDAFAGARGGTRDTAPQLVERLRARLGEDAVYGVVSIAEHRPEAAWQRVRELNLAVAAGTAPGTGIAAGTRAAAATSGAHPGTHEMPRPVWLLAEPVMLSAADQQRLNQGGLVLEEGPERIESGWWDGRGVARDYYVARHPQGARWWVFQERRTQCWYLHGVFA